MEPQEPTLTLTNSDAITQTNSSRAMKLSGSRTDSRLARLGHILAGTMALSAAIATSANTNLVRLLENRGQSLFFELRGPVAPPDNIVILAIDNESLKQIDIYLADPKKYSYLEPIKSWPFKRTAYAQAIDKIMAAGAKSVALDLILDRPSQYGAADDAKLQQVLRRYPGKVTLGAIYEDIETRQGISEQLTQPNRMFWTEPMSVGSVNYPLEPGNKIYQFGAEYRKILEQSYQKSLAGEFKSLTIATPSFSEAILTAAGINYPKPQGDRMYFYGPSGTFTQVPFWYVLDPVNWAGYLQNGNYFKDKIVLIGPTATELKDFHRTPFSQTTLYPEPLSGIEIHANAIASLQQGKAIRAMIPNAPLRGLFVLAGTVGAGIWLSRR
jgi:CHASE2 domain-containing sensor protein